VAALAGVITLPMVSRLTGRWSRPQALRNVHATGLGGPMPPPRLVEARARRSSLGAVHAYTALGLILAAAIALLIIRGSDGPSGVRGR
jgi:hypothetical protein